MKLDGKRITALLIALILMVNSLGALSLTVSAEGGEETSPYVFRYCDSSEGGDTVNKPYMYATAFGASHTITKEDGVAFYSGSSFPVIYQLISTEKNGASLAAYAIDAAAGIQSNTGYRRMNLEDSEYFDTAAAGKIRAVVLNSFPEKDMKSIQVRANSWLRSQSLPEIADLQSGEAILATQLAIWQLANGECYTIDSVYAGRMELTESILADVCDTSPSEQQETENTAQNIESLYQYLLSLDPVEPKCDTVSEASLENAAYSAVQETDGSYTVTVTVNVKATVGTRDKLSITAACGDQEQSEDVKAAGEYVFTFTGLPASREAKLVIKGYQYGGDVYLLDPEGEWKDFQSMVAYDNSRIPVYGKITLTPDRILNIIKSGSLESEKIPLANISFDIYKVATMEQLENGEVSLSGQPTEAEIERYQTAANRIATLTTDAQGFASYNFTEKGKDDGVYMVAERFSSATQGAAAPFFIVVPGILDGGGGYVYTQTINPENVIEIGPEIGMDVTGIDNNSDTFAVGKMHTWIIRGGIPAGIGNAQKYVISGDIDYRLDYESESPVVKLYTAAGRELTLEKNAHYILTEDTATVNEKTISHLTVALTPAGMAYVAANQGEGEHIPEVRVYFRAAINENAGMGEPILLSAHLDYINSAGIAFSADSDLPEVHTGGINILKADPNDAPLSGATFRIARAATEEELSDKDIHKDALNIGDRILTVIYEDFYASADMRGQKVNQVSTDTNGRAAAYGLAYGTYYLVETKAPEGYNLLHQPIMVTVNEASHIIEADGWIDSAGVIVDNSVKIINTKFVLPDTGGDGTGAFTALGILIIGSACILLLSNRKKGT